MSVLCNDFSNFVTRQKLRSLSDWGLKLLTFTDTYLQLLAVYDTYWQLLTVADSYLQLLTVTDTYRQVTDTNWHLQTLMTHANNEFEEKGRQSKLSTTDINEKAKWISARVPRALKKKMFDFNQKMINYQIFCPGNLSWGQTLCQKLDKTFFKQMKLILHFSLSNRKTGTVWQLKNYFLKY